MTEPGRRRTLAFEGAYDLGKSLMLGDYGRSNPGIRRPSDHELVRATQTPDGPATVYVGVDAGARRIEAEAWGPGAAAVLDALPTVLGLEASAPRFDGRLGRVQRRTPGVRLGRVFDVFELLASYVIRQRVAWRDAVASQVRLMRAFGEPAPGPGGLRLPLAPEQWLDIGTTELASFGLELKRARTLREVASRAKRIAGWAAELEPEAFGRKLELLRGIGPWTSGMVRGLGLGDGDVAPTGDYDLPSLISSFFADEPRADDARMLELLEPYRGHRFRVIHLLWAAGLTAPRFGHRKRGSGP